MCSGCSTVRGIVGILTLFACIILSSMARCPERNETQVFTTDQIVGNWYMLAATSTDGTNHFKCAYHNITKCPDTPAECFRIDFGGTGRWSNRSGSIFGIIDAYGDNRGYWYKRDGAPPIRRNPSRHRIISLEKEKHLIIVTCDVDNGHQINEASAILAPARTLPSEKLLELKENLGRFFNKSTIFDIEQTGCPY